MVGLRYLAIQLFSCRTLVGSLPLANNVQHSASWASGASPPSGSVGAIFRYIYIYIVRTSSSQCACVTCARFYLGVRFRNCLSWHLRSDLYHLRIPFVGEGKERERRARESVHRRRLCDQESARLQRPPRNQLDVVCGTGLYRLGGTFLGLYQVRRVAGESDEDREVRLQALRTTQYHWNLW